MEVQQKQNKHSVSLQCLAGQGAPQTEVAPWAVRFLCLLKDIPAMNLCSLYVMAFVFLASVPPCLDYEFFNFMKYCGGRILISEL